MQDEHEELECLGLAIIQWCQGRVGRGVLEGMHNVGDSSNNVIYGGGGGHWDFAWEPCNSVSDALGLGVSGPDSVTAVQMHGQAKVPAINAMWCPTATNTGFLMDDDASPRRSNRGAIEVKGAMELCPGR